MSWPSQMMLGIAAIDNAHKALIEELARLMITPDGQFEAGLAALIARMQCDFCEEEALMEAIDFTGLPRHREQHARVLSTLYHVIPGVMQGDCAAARKVIGLIPHWFLFHLSSMDTQLALALDLVGLQASPPRLPIAQPNVVR